MAAALTVLMQPGSESQAWLKLLALQKVVNSDLSNGDKLFLVEFMNTYAPASELFDPREEIMEKLANTEMTWGERLRAEGRAEGIEMQRQTLLRLLQWRFQLPETEKKTYERWLAQLNDPKKLMLLLDHLLTAQTLAEFTPKLRAYLPNPEQDQTENGVDTPK